jgi:hypothetical protein
LIPNSLMQLSGVQVSRDWSECYRSNRNSALICNWNSHSLKIKWSISPGHFWRYCSICPAGAPTRSRHRFAVLK